MEDTGWTKLWRVQFNHWVSDRKPWCDGYAWCYLCSRANHKKGLVNFRNEYIEIERGQFLTSQIKLSEKWGWTRKHVKRFLDALENDQMLTIRTTNRYIVITIMNYDVYQSKGDNNDQQNDQQERNRVSTEYQQEHTNKNVKKEKNVKNNITSLGLLFDKFWKEYPRKAGKEEARKAFIKVDPDEEDTDNLILLVKKQIECGMIDLRDNKKYCPHAATWLNQKRYLDGLEKK